jgi:hypothetical protein
VPLSTDTQPPTEHPVDELVTTELSAPTLNPNLTDPTAPGPTLDMGLVERIAQNPELVEAVNRNEDIARALERDPTSIDQIEQDLGLADQRPIEPSGVTGPAVVTEPEVPEPDSPDQDLDDQPDS